MGKDRERNENHLEEELTETERTEVDAGIKEYDLDMMTKGSTSEKTEEGSPAKVEMTVPETVNGIIVNTTHVKVRKTPMPDSEVVELLRTGDKVTIHRQVKDYYEISTSVNKHVYIRSIFVRKEPKKEG